LSQPEDIDDLSFFAPVEAHHLAVNLPELTQREMIFVQVFAGDVVQACRYAGYQGTLEQLRGIGDRLLRKPKIREALKTRGTFEEGLKKAIASKDERMMFYSSIMRNSDPYGKLDEDGKDTSQKEIPLAQRLKAAEMLSKSHGDFVETLNINHNHSISDVILDSFEDQTPIDVIEAQYKVMKERKELPPTPAGELGDLI
jgi:hypothetical protein